MNKDAENSKQVKAFAFNDSRDSVGIFRPLNRKNRLRERCGSVLGFAKNQRGKKRRKEVDVKAHWLNFIDTTLACGRVRRSLRVAGVAARCVAMQ